LNCGKRKKLEKRKRIVVDKGPKMAIKKRETVEH
jgi:hypothetical protein